MDEGLKRFTAIELAERVLSDMGEMHGELKDAIPTDTGYSVIHKSGLVTQVSDEAIQDFSAVDRDVKRFIAEAHGARYMASIKQSVKRNPV